MRAAAAITVMLGISVSTALAGLAPLTSLRPKARAAPVITGAITPTRPSTLATTVPVFRSPRPKLRALRLPKIPTPSVPTDLHQRLVNLQAPTVSNGPGLCGDRRIVGKRLPPILGTLPGCGVANPVKITAIDGVALSRASIMDCTTAQALTSWVSEGLKPLVGPRGGGIHSLTVISEYSCRTRNSKPGAKISEHGKGRALDISAINLKDGSRITVLKGWRDRRDRQILKGAFAAACGRFGTVLGPDADRYHLDHFHLDTARYRGGAYCR